MGSFLFCLEGSTLFWSKGSNSFGLRGQSELDFPIVSKQKISQLEKDVLKGMTVENFKREKARNNSDPFSHSQL